jgi:hypothetical protein
MFLSLSTFSRKFTVYEIQATYGNIIQRMRYTCWITKATNTQSDYVILRRLSVTVQHMVCLVYRVYC